MNNVDYVSGLEFIFDLSPDPLCLLTPNGCFVMVNEVLKEALSYTEEELLSGYFLDFIHPDDKEHTIKKVESLLEDKTSCLFESRYRCANEQYKWFSWNVKKLPDNTFYASLRDITNHARKIKRAEKSLIESDENYKLLFYSNPLPIVIYDMETLAIMNVNQMATELYGYTGEEFLDLTIKDVYPHEEIPLIIEAIKNRAFNKEVNNLGTWNHIKKNGTPIKVEMIGHSIEYMERHCMIVVCKDITDQSNTLRSLELSIERFEYVTEATSDIIWDWNLETNEVTYSGNIEKSFGHTPGVNIGDMRFFAMHVHPDDRERVVLYPNPVKYGTMKSWTEEYRFRKANGEYAFVLDKGIVIRDEQGTGVRMIGAIQDVTTLKRQNERLTEIALINAHEIRRPVATILGLLSLFKETIESESNRELVKHLESVTHELDTVIRRIIDKTVT